MTLRAVLFPTLLLALVAGGAWAQEGPAMQGENVRYVYAQVLSVSPFYQTLTATRMEQQCDQTPAPPDDDSRLSRMVGVVKGALGRERTETEAEAERVCRAVLVERQFHRPIAYDVDYVYRGAKYRSRLAEDPGNRLRIRIGVTPMPLGPRSR